MRRAVLAGLAIGALWGVAIRLWMRFITTSPEFSWSGTLMIIGFSAAAGGVLALARFRRKAGGTGWWRASILSLVFLGGAGSVMWSSVLLGGIFFGRPGPKWLRWAAAAGAVALQIPTVQDVVLANPRLDTVESVIAIVWYAALVTVEAWGFSIAFAPVEVTAPVPGKLKKVVMTLPFVALLALAVVGSGVLGME
jgi:hypothetical protein